MSAVPIDELHELYEHDRDELLARLQLEQVPGPDRHLSPHTYRTRSGVTFEGKLFGLMSHGPPRPEPK